MKYLYVFIVKAFKNIHCYQDVKSIPWNITKSVSEVNYLIPTLPLSAVYKLAIIQTLLYFITWVLQLFSFNKVMNLLDEASHTADCFTRIYVEISSCEKLCCFSWEGG